jgi:hypothetical protein
MAIKIDRVRVQGRLAHSTRDPSLQINRDQCAGVTRDVTFTGHRVSALRQNFGTDRVLGHFGGGLEYRFTPHIGLFGEAGYDLVNGASNNFVQANFCLRYKATILTVKLLVRRCTKRGPMLQNAIAMGPLGRPET